MKIPGLPGTARVVTGDQIAADALRWRGQGYVFGGNGSRPGLWDCSNFASFVLGKDLGLAIPGGRWGGRGMPPATHGPTVESYASWKGAITVGSPARGDLVLFVGQGASGHMGFYVGPITYKGQHYDHGMMSALDSTDGTLETPIQGFGPPGAPVVYRRVIAAAAGTALTGVAGQVSAAPGPGVAGAALALLTVAAMAAAVVLAAAVLGTAAVLAGTWAMSKAAGSA